MTSIKMWTNELGREYWTIMVDGKELKATNLTVEAHCDFRTIATVTFIPDEIDLKMKNEDIQMVPRPSQTIIKPSHKFGRLSS